MSDRFRAASSFGGARRVPAPPPTRPEPLEPLAVEPEAVEPAPRSPEPQPEPVEPEVSPFLEALTALLVKRGLAVPEGLAEAPPAAYAGQSAAAVATLARLKDADLAERASKVAGWQARQAQRAQQIWDSSPLIGELRRRGLPEPPRPARPAGVAFSLKRPLAEWSDDELQDAATEWARLGQ